MPRNLAEIQWRQKHTLARGRQHGLGTDLARPLATVTEATSEDPVERKGLKFKSCGWESPGLVTLVLHLRTSHLSQCEGYVSPEPCPGEPWPGCQSPQLTAASF